jgi:hypothetical protein
MAVDSKVNVKQSKELIKKSLAKSHACYVLITCDSPGADGNGEMQVEMDYDGDPFLASYLIQGAQSIIDEHTTEMEE